jgi:hypothetical protein
VPKVTFTSHAEAQIAERKLPRELIGQTVDQPDETKPSGSRQVRQRVFRFAGKDYMIRAVCEQLDDEIVVVTVYRTSKLAKYRGV